MVCLDSVTQVGETGKMGLGWLTIVKQVDWSAEVMEDHNRI